jgi:hypothetical protein
MTSSSDIAQGIPPMTHVMTPFTLSAAGFRLAGYFLQNNMRVAQEFGRAAMLANPYLLGMGAKYRAPVTKAPGAAKPVTRAAKPATRAVSTRGKTAGKAADAGMTGSETASMPLASDPKAAAPKASGQVVPMTPARVAQKTVAPQNDSATPKRPRAPSKPPAMPAPRSVAMTGRDSNQA